MTRLWSEQRLWPLYLAVMGLSLIPSYHAASDGAELPEAVSHAAAISGHEIPGLPFQVFVEHGDPVEPPGVFDEAQAEAALQTVIDALSYLRQHRQHYPRFDEAVSKRRLDRVIIRPSVHNLEGRAFPFLTVRTVDPGRVVLLISASLMKEGGYVGRAERFAQVLAREFQWVVSKAETVPKPVPVSVERDLRHTPIHSDKDIRVLSGEERVRLLQELFQTYLRTVDDQRSLDGQSYYETGSTELVTPSQSDSTTKFYEIRVREALQKIVREPEFLSRTPLAVIGLLNGKIWNVAFVTIGQRDWATRTRVVPPDRAVRVGEGGRLIQPAAILINLHRTATPDDPFYADTRQLPMGALSPDQLAAVIAKEIQQSLIEKSQTGHVAQDAITAPK